MEVTLGIDIGGTNTKLGFVNREGECLVDTRISTNADKPVKEFIGHLMVAIEELKLEVNQVEIKAIGIGAPNANFYTGKIEQAPNLHWGKEVAIANMVYEKCQLPVWITNDANAAAIGEMKFGVAKGMKNFVVITLGTGLGSGFVMNGRLIYGHDGFAGELGHVTAIRGGRDHTTGRKGSLETYVSATGLKRTVFELLALRITESRLRHYNFQELTSKEISEAAEVGDKIALEAFEFTGRILGQILHNVILLMNPEAIILFGGMANAGTLLTDPTIEHMEKNLPESFKGKTKILMSDLKGDNTAILGASALAWEEWEKSNKNQATVNM